MISENMEGTVAQIIFTRVFDASREKVWQAWTEPEKIKQWWGPKDFTAPSITSDFRVGGTYLYCMRGPQGSPWDKNLYSGGVYKEIVPIEKTVVSDYFSDENGNKLDPAVVGLPSDMPAEMDVTA